MSDGGGKAETVLRNEYILKQGDIPTWEDDRLTGVKNRNAFDLAIQNLEGDVALILIDVDNFKEVNDKFGHSKGDIVLRFVGLGLESNLRESEERPDDVSVYRYGGDEFAVILKNIGDIRVLEKIAKRIHDAITTQNVPGMKDYKQNLSIGAAILNIDSHNKNDLFELADKALYKAKESGRNQVVMAE